MTLKKNLKQRKTQKIVSPTHLCLYDEEKFEEALAFFKKLNSLPNDKSLQIIVDLTELIYVSAAAITTLFNIVASKQLEVTPSHVVVTLPEDKATKSLLKETGFVTAVKQGGMKKLQSLWDNSNFVCGNHSDVSRFQEKIKQLSNRATLPNKLGVATRESLLNINHHAYLNNSGKPSLTWWSYIYVGEDDDKGQYLATVITDRGGGIPRGIRPVIVGGQNILIRDGIHTVSDGECILQAMKESVTRTGELGRGKGSVDMKRPVQITSELGQHRLLVLSQGGRYSFEVDEKGKVIEKTSNMSDNYNGTLIEWFLYFEES